MTKSLIHTVPATMRDEDIAAGLSPLRCSKCDTRFPEAALLTNRNYATCGACKNSIDKAHADVTPDSVHLLDEATAHGATWFHATNVENWHDKLLGLDDFLEPYWDDNEDEDEDEVEIPYVHLGTWEAAMERAKDAYFGSSSFHAADTTVFVYEVRLTPNARLSSHFVKDEDDWFDIVTNASIKDIGADAVRYVNAFEATGAISLLANPNYIEIVSVRIIEDATATTQAA